MLYHRGVAITGSLSERSETKRVERVEGESKRPSTVGKDF